MLATVWLVGRHPLVVTPGVLAIVMCVGLACLWEAAAVALDFATKTIQMHDAHIIFVRVATLPGLFMSETFHTRRLAPEEHYLISRRWYGVLTAGLLEAHAKSSSVMSLIMSAQATQAGLQTVNTTTA